MASKAGARSFRDRRRRSVICKEKQKPDLGARVAESAGQTAAGCAAVFCCCPFGLASLLYLAAVKFPAGLVRRSLGRGVMFAKKGAGVQPKKDVLDYDDDDWIPVVMWTEDAWPSMVASPELVALEKEMSEWFYGAGSGGALRRRSREFTGKRRRKAGKGESLTFAETEQRTTTD